MPHDSAYLTINRDSWTRHNAAFTDTRAGASWSREEITWGVWSVPEETVRVLPELRGKDVVELGCGTAYVSAWLKRRGARRAVGVDLTAAQLATARRLNRMFDMGLELIQANAERVPLRGDSFDLAVSEYGASIWCDPYLWIPEAARLLRLGGELLFVCNTPISMLCMPDTGQVGETLLRPERAMHRLEWHDDDPGVEFHLPHGEMLRLLRSCGFDVLDLVELYAADDAETHEYYDYVTADWARRWPSEEIWRAVLVRR